MTESTFDIVVAVINIVMGVFMVWGCLWTYHKEQREKGYGMKQGIIVAVGVILFNSLNIFALLLK